MIIITKIFSENENDCQSATEYYVHNCDVRLCSSYQIVIVVIVNTFLIIRTKTVTWFVDDCRSEVTIFVCVDNVAIVIELRICVADAVFLAKHVCRTRKHRLRLVNILISRSYGSLQEMSTLLTLTDLTAVC